MPKDIRYFKITGRITYGETSVIFSNHRIEKIKIFFQKKPYTQGLHKFFKKSTYKLSLEIDSYLTNSLSR